MKFAIKQLGADIQAPHSVLKASGTSLSELEVQFEQWLLNGLSQMDWSQVTVQDLPVEAITLPEIDIELEKIDWQFVQLDPFAAFKHYVFPVLRRTINTHLNDLKHTKALSPQQTSDMLNLRGKTLINGNVIGLLTQVLAKTPPTIFAKMTMKLELKRMLSTAFQTSKTSLMELQAHPDWPYYRHLLVRLFGADTSVILQLLRPLYPAVEHERLSKLLTKLNAAQLEHFVSQLELSNVTTANRSRCYPNASILLSLYEQFISYPEFSETLLRQACLALHCVSQKQAISMWCTVQQNRRERSAVGHLQRIIHYAAKQSDMALALLGDSKTALDTLDMAMLPKALQPKLLTNKTQALLQRELAYKRRKQLEPLYQILAQLSWLDTSHALPSQRIKAWIKLQTIRANPQMLNAAIFQQLTQVTELMMRMLPSYKTENEILEKIWQLVAKIRETRRFSVTTPVDKYRLCKLYSLVNRLADVPVTVLQAPVKWLAAHTIPARALSAWLDEVTAWCVSHQQKIKTKTHNGVLLKVDLTSVSQVLQRMQTRAAALQKDKGEIIGEAAKNELQGMLSIVKSLPIPVRDNLWAKLQCVECWHSFIRILTDLEAEYNAIEPASVVPATLQQLDEDDFAFVLNSQIIELTKRLTLRLSTLMQQFEQQQLLSPKLRQAEAKNSLKSTPIWQCALRSHEILTCALALQSVASPSLSRLYALVSTQKIWLLNELSFLEQVQTQAAAEGEKIHMWLTEHSKALNSFSKQIEQAAPLIDRAYSHTDRWLTPVFNHACDLLESAENLWRLPNRFAEQIQKVNYEEPQEIPHSNSKHSDNNELSSFRVFHNQENGTTLTAQSQAQLPTKLEPANPLTDFVDEGQTPDKEQNSTDLTSSATYIEQRPFHNLNMQAIQNLHQPERPSNIADNLGQSAMTEKANPGKSKELQDPEQVEVQHATSLIGADFTVSSDKIDTKPLHEKVDKIQHAKDNPLAMDKPQQQTKSTSPSTLIALLTHTTNLEQAQQLLTQVSQYGEAMSKASVPAEQQQRLQRAVKRSQQQLAQLANANRPSLQVAIKNAIAGVQSQIEQLQKSNESQQANPITFDAGLVILWPFLPTLFSKLGFLYPESHEQAGEFVSNEAKLKAHAALCYIANVEPLIEVSHTACVLLDLPLHAELNYDEPDEDTKDAIDYMLQAVVSRWEVLKGMPKAEFVRLFIAREGTVESTDTGYHVAVSTLPQDVLMAKLPWGLGMVQLPWLGQTLIHIEWKYGF
ncbi:contractile injection system tape measure protein (plasmid) [Pseudoalteromonas sp. T1lg65]|uniref:contractile injection system tape measure protein n=1 Tax=Pseudoalteromonas sp. T1lg65 TaxID=2077101 RepID=UPI003F78F91B